MPPRAPAPLACAAALAALVTVALAQQLCETTQFGNRSPVPIIRAVRRVEPGMYTLEINEQDVCGESEAVGLRVRACDADTAPRVLLLDAARGMVVRGGALAGAALVYSTVYCAAPAAATSDETDQLATDYMDQPATDTSTSTSTSSPSPLLSLSTKDSPPISKVEPADEYLPPIKLESRFSTIDQFNGPVISNSLSSKLKNLWKDRVSSSGFQENEQLLFNKNKYQTSIFDPYSTFIKSFPKSSSPPSLAQRLIDLRPKQQNEWLENRAPLWKKRPTRRPSSPWLKLRSQSDNETRKAMSPSHRRANAFDYNDPWTPYEDDPLSLQWTDDPIDSIPTRGDSYSPFTNSFPWQIKPPKIHNLYEGPHSASHHNRPSPSSIKHDSKKQSRIVPPIHEEDPALLMEWNKNQPRSKRPALPKLLLLLHDQEQEESVQRCSASVHSVEDTDSWWLNKPNKDKDDEGIPWEPDYPADYTAGDGDARSYSSWNYIDDRITSNRIPPSYVAPAKKRAPTRPPRHRVTPPTHLVDAQLAPHASHKPPANSKARPVENYFYYSPTPLTERPLLTSTVRNSLPWIKSSKANSLKSPMKLKKPRPKKLLQKSNHHFPRDHSYPPGHHFPIKPLVLADTNYTADTYNPSDLQPNPVSKAEESSPSEPHLQPGPQLPPGLQLPTGPHYPPETYNPSHLQPNPFYDAELHFPSDPYYPSNSYNPSDPYYPLEHNYPLENHEPSGPQFPSESDSAAESGNVPLDLHYPPELHYPTGHHFPAKPNYLSESGNVPSEPQYPPEPNYPSELEYPSKLENVPSEPLYPSYFPSELDYPSLHHYPLEPGYVPSKPQYPSEPDYPLGPYYPSDSDYPSGNHYSPEPHYRPGSYYPLDPDYPPEHHYSPEPHYRPGPYSPLDPDFPLEHHYLPEPHYRPGSDYPPDSDYSSEQHYSPEPHYPPRPHLPSGPNVPSKPHYPTEPHYPTGLYYPPDLDYPNEPHYPSESHNLHEPHYPSGSKHQNPSKYHYPSKHRYPPKHHYPSGSRYPSGDHVPSGPHHPSETNDLSQYLQSTEPWKFLSELLLSHPSFRDSTHVIRIR